jgi:hypothetical protein
MERKDLIEGAALAVMLIGTIGVVVSRVTTGKGIGYRVLQWLGIVILPPTVLILALEKILSGEITGALIAALVGFATSELSRGQQ